MTASPVLDNPRADRVTAVRGLLRRAARARTGRFVADGPGSVAEAVRHRPEDVVEVFVTAAAAARHRDVVADAAAAGIRIRETSERVMSVMSDTTTPQGLLAVCRIGDASLTTVLSRRPHLVVVLDEVRDPGNAGTVLRAADAAGADAVVLTSGSVDVHHPRVVRSSAGSLFHLPVVTGVPGRKVVGALQRSGLRVYAADARGATVLHIADLRGPHAWVFGNEAHGLSGELREQCDDTVRVPIHGAAESLNLAMAATVCVYASASQRAEDKTQLSGETGIEG